MMISVVLPAYKEAKNLETIIPRINEVLKEIKHEILVIDTIEPMDNTKEVCNQYGAVYISRENGNYYGDAIRTGFNHASGEYTVVMDADGSHDPQDICRFFKEMEENKYDLVIGSRYCKGGYTDNPAILRAMSWVLNLTYRILFGLKVKDVSDSYRMYRTAALKDMQFECLNFDIVEEILIKLSLRNKKFAVKEIPISFSKRAAGESKRDLVKFIFSYISTIRRLLEIKRKAKCGASI